MSYILVLNKLKVAFEQAALLSLCHFIPKDKNLWVFGCVRGYAEGCAAIIKIADREKKTRNIWLYRSKSEKTLLEAYGHEHYKLKSIKGYWYCLRANLAFIAYGFNDLNGTAIFRSKIINVWHGTPLKTIYFDSPQLGSKVGLNQLKNIAKHLFTKRIQLFPVSSELSKKRIEKAFRLRTGVAQITGEPRTDKIFSSITESSSDNSLPLSLLKSLGPEKLILYAPTWRPGHPPTTNQQEILHLIDFLECHDKYLILRPHPRDENNHLLKVKHERIIKFLQKDYQDIYNYLYLFGSLITDYSSIAIDFSITKRPIYFLAQDTDDYVQKQGLYESYDTFTCANWSSDWRSLIDTLVTEKYSSPKGLQSSSELFRRYHVFNDGQASRRTYEICLRLTET